MWFVHYVAVLLGGILFVVLVERWRRFFLDGSVAVKTDTGLVYWCLAIVWGCSAVFVFGHWSATPDDLY
jgi:hypothetical protein